MTIDVSNWMPANSATKAVEGHMIVDLIAYAMVHIRLLVNLVPLDQVRYGRSIARALEA